VQRAKVTERFLPVKSECVGSTVHTHSVLQAAIETKQKEEHHHNRLEGSGKRKETKQPSNETKKRTQVRNKQKKSKALRTG
jgi:hypothetical protein